MKRFLSLTLCLAMVAAATTAFAAQGTAERDTNEYHFAVQSDQGTTLTSSSSDAALRFRETDGPDTFSLMGGPGILTGKFQDVNGVLPDAQGWTGHDLTDQPIYWQISTFNAANLNGNGAGNNAYWCGRDTGQVTGWDNTPGYGNGWNDALLYEVAVSDPLTGQTVSLDFVYNHDTEPGYDYLRCEYDSAGTWTSVLARDGSNRDASNVFNAPGETFAGTKTGDIVYVGGDYGIDDVLRIRIRVTSDGGWSDEDGLWPTVGGAAQVDDIAMTNSEGTFSEDFEGLAPYLFNPDKAPFVGDFFDTHARFTEIDPCRDDTTPVFAFIDYGQDPPNGPGTTGAANTGGSQSSSGVAYGIPGNWVTNYTGGLSFGDADLTNEAYSPELAWDLPTAGDDGVDFAGAKIRFSVWRHLPLGNGIFYVWHVRAQTSSGDWTGWGDRNFVYYGGGVTDFYNHNEFVSDLLGSDVVNVQLALGAWDYASIFAFAGDDATPSPVFDNAAFYKFRIGGPTFATRTIDTAQDAFPTNGLVSAATPAEAGALDVAFSMARDRSTGAVNVPGDSIMIDIVNAIPGAAIADMRMKWALYRNPLFDDYRTPPARAKDEGFDDTSVAGVWFGEVVHDSSTTSAGAIVDDRFFFDLPDVDFMYPGDQLHYYIEATDDGAGSVSGPRTTTFPANTTGFGQWDVDGVSTYNRTFVVRALPSIKDAGGSQPTILLYNDFGRRGQENEQLSAMNQLGFIEGTDFDTYTTQGPTSGVSNGIGGRAIAGQLAGYDTIIYLAGDLSTFLFSDGTNEGQNDKGDDLGVMTAWKGLDGQRNTMYFADNIASATAADSPIAGAGYVATVMGVTLNDNDVSDEIENQTAPVVRGVLGTFIGQDYVAYGGCLLPNQFDSIEPAGGAVPGHSFLSTAGTPYPAGPVASVVYDRIENGFRKVDITFPYGLGFVYDKNGKAPAGASARAILFEKALQYFGKPSSGSGAATAAPKVREASLKLFPNPFNPKTTVEFALPARAEATVKVYNLRGELVRTLAAGELQAGPNKFVWDGTDDAGKTVSSGVYLVNAVTKGYNATKKAILVK